MIELDRWQSQLVYLAKGYAESEIDKNTDFEVLLKNLWSNRTGIPVEYIRLGYVANVLLALVQQVTPNFDLNEFVNRMRPIHYGEIIYTDNQSYAKRVCWTCLYHYLIVLQIRDYNKNGKLFDLIKLKPFEINLLTKGISIDENN